MNTPTPDARHGLGAYASSKTKTSEAELYLAQRPDGTKRLCVRGDAAGFVGERQGDVLLCPLTAENAAELRARLAWLRPVPLGLHTSFGFGDRLGLATPGHARAAAAFRGGGVAIAPVFAQQSARENARTGRTPQEVLDDAMWGAFQAGWRAPWGADADHLKTMDAANDFVEAGYTLYTIDPGDHVDDAAHTAERIEVEVKVEALPWEALESDPQDMERRYLGRTFDLACGEQSQSKGPSMRFDQETLYRAAAKYGGAILHTAQIYRYLLDRMGDEPFELEVSVDETETPTSPAEHLYIASELDRLGVAWVSLAPRYVGRFEKGVDYIGSVNRFAADLEKHAAIARTLGPYKLSLHSGSDKFSIYPILARVTDGLVHVKTAGTSYLEALRAVALVDPGFFRQILELARQRYETDRASYHVSADLDRVPTPEAPDRAQSEGALPDHLDQFHTRQVLHVTFGSVLDRFEGRLVTTLRRHEDLYARLLESHFRRHLAPFAESPATRPSDRHS